MDTAVNLWSKSSPLVIGAVALGSSIIGYVVVNALSGPPKGSVYPPGPPQDPIIGSLRSFPKDALYDTFNKWQKQYGDIVYLQFPGTPMMIVNSLDIAHELFSKRASTNSDRSIPYMAKDLLGWSWSIAFRPPDSTHQLIRKMLRRGIGPQRVPSHDALVEEMSTRALLELREFKGNPTETIMHSIGHIVIQVTYGEQIWETHGPELIAQNTEAMDILMTVFGKIWMVDILPILRFIPSWMPGAKFRRLGNRSTYLTDRIRQWPFQRSVELYKSKELGHSLVNDLFDEFGQTEAVKDALGILYFVGVDTTSSAIIHFLHCMFMFPEVAKKVQQEIEEVVGNDRLLKVSDRAHLHYTEAVWKESLRWKGSVPIAIPHTSTEDTIINGYFIPKGSVINPNIGFMLNDPRIWGDPEEFRPERHLASHNPDVASLPDPTTLIFGFGMRICPGKDLANRVGFHASVAIVAMYDILPLKGKHAPDPKDAEYTTDTVRWPKEFDCRFVPRNENSANMLSALAVSGSH